MYRLRGLVWCRIRPIGSLKTFFVNLASTLAARNIDPLSHNNRCAKLLSPFFEASQLANPTRVSVSTDDLNFSINNVTVIHYVSPTKFDKYGTDPKVQLGKGEIVLTEASKLVVIAIVLWRCGAASGP